MLLLRGRGVPRLWFILSAAGAAVIALLLAAPLPARGIQHAWRPARRGADRLPSVRGHRIAAAAASPPRSRPTRLLAHPAADRPAGHLPRRRRGLCRLSQAQRSKANGSHLQMLALGILVILSLAVSWLLASTIGNNDLGWRAMLPAVLVLTPISRRRVGALDPDQGLSPPPARPWRWSPPACLSAQPSAT